MKVTFSFRRVATAVEVDLSVKRAADPMMKALLEAQSDKGYAEGRAERFRAALESIRAGSEDGAQDIAAAVLDA